jgi:hypothetical protein
MRLLVIRELPVRKGWAQTQGEWGKTNTMSGSSRFGLIVAIVSSVALFLAAVASAASSAGPTRDDYVERVEPICKSATQAHRSILQGIEKTVREGKTGVASVRFIRAADAFEEVVRKLAAVPRPPGDEARIERWLGHAKTGDKLLRKMARTLKKGKQSKAEAIAHELLQETKRGNAVVVGFDFESCRLNPARFV